MKYKRIVRIILILFIALCSNMNTSKVLSEEIEVKLTREEQDYIDTRSTVKMCVDPDWYPYERIDENGLHQGIAAELIQLISERTGIKIELVPTKNWEESITYSKEQKCDLLSFLNKTRDREKWLIFTNPYFVDPNVLITREEHEYISDLSRLSNEIAVLPEGTSVEERIKSDYPNIKVLIVASEKEAMEYVSSRKADFTVRSLTMAAYTIRDEGLFNLKIAGQIANYENNLCIGVNREDPLLCQILNKGIASISQEEVQQIMNNHIPVNISQGFDYRLFFIIFGAFTLIVLAAVLWNLQLQKFNKRLEVQKTELALVRDRLMESEALYRSFLNASPDAVVISNANGIILAASSKAYSLVEMEENNNTLIGKKLINFISETSKELMMENFAKLFRTGETSTNVYEGVRINGHTFIMEINSEVIRNVDGIPIQMVSIIRDITKRRRMEEDLQNSERNLRQLTMELENQNLQLHEIATYDKLTGIRNRYYLENRISEELSVYMRNEIPLSIILFDLDKFKIVNDTFGHDVGDQVLVRIANTVQKNIRKSDVFARWGGEEFIIVLLEKNIEKACEVAEKIRSVVEQINHPQVGKVTISIGVAEYRKGEDANDWFKRADIEMYKAKSLGRNCISCSETKEGGIHLRISWEKAWNCGNYLIDNQHQKLLELGNIFIESALNDKCNSLTEDLNKLIEHIIQHFMDEERILRKMSYVEIDAHFKSHEELIQKAMSLRDQVTRNEISISSAFEFIVKDIIMNHLLNEDIKYFPLMKEAIDKK